MASNTAATSEVSKKPRARPPPLPLILLHTPISSSGDAEESPTKIPLTHSEWDLRLQAEPNLRKLLNEVLNAIIFHKKSARANQHGHSAFGHPPVEFLPGFWLGSAEDAIADSIPRFDNIVAVMDDISFLRPSIEPGINFNHIYARDDGNTNLMKSFPDACRYLDESASNGKTLIHCVAGINRSATLATAYYMRKTGKSLFDAIDHMVRLRPIILSNEDFIAQLTIWAVENGHAKLE